MRFPEEDEWAWKAKQLKPGDVIIYRFGLSSEVLCVVRSVRSTGLTLKHLFSSEEELIRGFRPHKLVGHIEELQDGD